MSFCHNKNKNELMALTGAVYSFVAYLTAFTLEILFIIELAKRSSGLIPIPSSSATTSQPFSSLASNTFNSGLENDEISLATILSMQTNLTISCLAISILYFVLFVSSLLLITGLIIQSTFFILIWMCIMITMYLPELTLIVYVSVYGWGIDTRNGQTELIFYLFRAALNVIFLYRARKLRKEWNYEKNFFMLKSGSRFTGYDSPYFIGDTLTTTLNPIFTSSTLHLDRYDQVRDLNTSNTLSSRQFPDFSNHYQPNNLGERKIGEFSLRGDDSLRSKYRSNLGLGDPQAPMDRFYLDGDYATASRQEPRSGGRLPIRQNSVHSVNDYADFEWCLDYNTLSKQQQEDARATNLQQKSHTANESGSRLDLSKSQAGDLSYSTQSLDRRQLRDLEFLPEHVILRPLGRQPFDYLQRPGSSSISNLNAQHSSTYSSNSKLAKEYRSK